MVKQCSGVISLKTSNFTIENRFVTLYNIFPPRNCGQNRNHNFILDDIKTNLNCIISKSSSLDEDELGLLLAELRLIQKSISDLNSKTGQNYDEPPRKKARIILQIQEETASAVDKIFPHNDSGFVETETIPVAREEEVNSDTVTAVNIEVERRETGNNEGVAGNDEIEVPVGRVLKCRAKFGQNKELWCCWMMAIKLSDHPSQ